MKTAMDYEREERDAMTLCPTCGRHGSQRGTYCPSLGRGGFFECHDVFHDRADRAEEAFELLREVAFWRGLDGDGITDPLCSKVMILLASLKGRKAEEVHDDSE